MVELAPEAALGTALDLLMVEGSAQLHQRRRPNPVMLQHAGVTLESGASAPCPVEALEHRQGLSLALSQRMVDRPVQLRKS